MHDSNQDLGPLLSTMLFQRSLNFRSIRTLRSGFSEERSALIFLRSFIFRGVRKFGLQRSSLNSCAVKTPWRSQAFENHRLQLVHASFRHSRISTKKMSITVGMNNSSRYQPESQTFRIYLICVYGFDDTYHRGAVTIYWTRTVYRLVKTRYLHPFTMMEGGGCVFFVHVSLRCVCRYSAMHDNMCCSRTTA